MKIGIIGAGKMAQALARGFIASGRYPCNNLMCSCPRVDVRLLDQCKNLGINTTHDNTEIARENDIILVAVKPQYVSKVCSEIAPIFRRNQLLVSTALGIPIQYIEQLLPPKSRVVRVMPNTPVVVGAGCSAYSMGGACQDGDSGTVEELLSTVGYTVEVPEGQLDSVTGLSGSGPAYVCAFVEGMADGGVKLGLPRDLAIRLAAHTLYGAAKMILETEEHPAILKEAVQSPGGSTIFGMHELEKGGLKALLINAVEAASNRSRNTGISLLPRQSSVLYRSSSDC